MHKKSAAAAAGVGLLVALTTVLGLRESWHAREMSSNPVAEVAANARHGGQPQLLEPHQVQSSGFQVQPPIENASVPSSSSNNSASTDHQRQKPGRLESVVSSEVTNPTLDTSVIGRPFPLSPSARSDCSPGDMSIDCEYQHRLDQLAGEPRDLAWAPQVENALRNHMHQRNSGFSLRNVECRLVTCALEVASLDGVLSLSKNLPFEEWRTVQARPFGYLLGLESDALSRRITVTLYLYERVR
jgi:hypothetical protein